MFMHTNNKNHNNHYLHAIRLQVLLSGDISVNPGPMQNPCDACQKPVRKNQRAIICDECCCIPPDKVHNKFCKYILGWKKWASSTASRSELGMLPIDCFIKTQSLLYEDRILANDTPLILKVLFTFQIHSWERDLLLVFVWQSCKIRK
jgi:hypothetical protein